MHRPADRQALWLFIYQNFGVALPHRRFTPGHSTPFDFVAEAFFCPGADLAAWASRSGLKTLCASIIAALEFRFSGRPIRGRVLSGSEDQARNLYGYWEHWCRRVLRDLARKPEPYPNLLRDEPGRLLTRLENGDFEILAASQKRVRGAKVQRLFRDEVDEIEPEVMAASVGMLASIDGVPARTIDTSTWHYPRGPMGRLVEQADGRGIRLHKWNIWESLARCGPQRHDGGRGCAECPLGRVCVAKAREVHGPRASVGIAAECRGLFAIDDAIKQFRQWSLQQWRAEAECRRPSLGGRVYPQFDRATHVRTDLAVRADLPLYRSIDWGLSNFVCLWVQVDPAGCAYVIDEYCGQEATVRTNAQEIQRRHPGAAVERTYCDPAGRNRNDQTGYSDVEVFRGLGIPCTYTLSPWATEVRNGVNLIRSHLRPAAGGVRLFVSARCVRLIAAFEGYRLRRVNGQYVDEPVKPQPHEHVMDALRYFFVNRAAPTRATVCPVRYT